METRGAPVRSVGKQATSGHAVRPVLTASGAVLEPREARAPSGGPSPRASLARSCRTTSVLAGGLGCTADRFYSVSTCPCGRTAFSKHSHPSDHKNTLPRFCTTFAFRTRGWRSSEPSLRPEAHKYPVPGAQPRSAAPELCPAAGAARRRRKPFLQDARRRLRCSFLLE